MVKKICYLKIPLFYWQMQCLFFPELKKKPVVIGGSVKNYGIVMEVSPLAVQSGIRPGMLSVYARQLLPDVVFIPPDSQHYEQFLKKIINIMDNFSVKLIKDTYNAFFLFLPDYFHLISIVKEIQYLIFLKYSINTQAGLSDNKYVARLAAQLTAYRDMLYIDKNNALKVLSLAKIEDIYELTEDEIKKLKLAGVNTISDLFELDLYQLRFFLGDKGELLYYNYISQVKTVRETDKFIYEEVLFYNTVNQLPLIMTIVEVRIKHLLNHIIKKTINISKCKVYIEYVDNKNYIYTRKLKKKKFMKEIISTISFLLNQTRRRVRIKKMGFYFFYTFDEVEYLWPQKNDISSPLVL